MKRKVCCSGLLILFLGLFFAIPTMAVPVANLNLVGSPSGIESRFKVEVWAYGDNINLDLISFGFDVTFENGSIFLYNGYTLGTGFDDDSFGPGNVAGSALPGFIENDVLLATLSFESLSPGTDTLSVIGLYDGSFSGIYYELEDLSRIGYAINQSLELTNVPIPSALFLMFSGLFALVAAIRKS